MKFTKETYKEFINRITESCIVYETRLKPKTGKFCQWWNFEPTFKPEHGVELITSVDVFDEDEFELEFFIFGGDNSGEYLTQDNIDSFLKSFKE